MSKLTNCLVVILLVLSLVSCDVININNKHVHSFSEWKIIKPASCTEDGERLRICTCGEEEKDPIEALGHLYGEWVVEQEATYSEPGLKSRVCKCGESETAIIEILAPVFIENFDGTTLNRNNWSLCPEWIRHDGGSIWDNDMTSLDGNGNLVLRAEWDAENNRAKCGAIRSKDLFEYGYGDFEASIKFPVAQGVWGAFWINCGNISSVDGSARDGVEIDVIETIFNENGLCSAALHWDGYSNAHKEVNSGHMSYDIYDGEFHLFAVDRTPLGYTFYIDGIVVWTAYQFDCSPCPEPGFLLLTLEATYIAGLSAEAAEKYLPAVMLVDYVKVYEKNPYIQN